MMQDDGISGQDDDVSGRDRCVGGDWPDYSMFYTFVGAVILRVL